MAERPRSVIAAHCDFSEEASCFIIMPPAANIPLWLLVLPLSWLALGASYVVLAQGALAYLWRCNAPPRPVALLASLVIQGQAAVTATVGAGELRYSAPLVPFIVALALVCCLDAARWFAARRLAPQEAQVR